MNQTHGMNRRSLLAAGLALVPSITGMSSWLTGSPAHLLLQKTAKPTDIRLREIQSEFEEYRYGIPYQFGANR